MLGFSCWNIQEELDFGTRVPFVISPSCSFPSCSHPPPSYTLSRLPHSRSNPVYKIISYLSFKAKASLSEMIGWLNQVRQSTTSTLSKPTAAAVFSKKLDLIQMIQIFKSIDGGSQMAIGMDLRDANRAIRFGYLNYLNQMTGKEASGRRVQRRRMVMWFYCISHVPQSKISHLQSHAHCPGDKVAETEEAARIRAEDPRKLRKALGVKREAGFKVRTNERGDLAPQRKSFDIYPTRISLVY